MFPGARSIRAVSRIWSIAYAFLLFGAMLGIDALFRVIWRRPASQLIASLILCCAAISEQLTAAQVNEEYPDFLRHVSEVAPLIRGADAAYLVVNVANSDQMRSGVPYWTRRRAVIMWAGMAVNVPVVNGYSAWWPAGDGPYDPPMPVEKLISLMGRDWHGKLCIVVDRRDADELKNYEGQLSGVEGRQSGDFVGFDLLLAPHRNVGETGGGQGPAS